MLGAADCPHESYAVNKSSTAAADLRIAAVDLKAHPEPG
jgi:hypothetical protein